MKKLVFMAAFAVFALTSVHAQEGDDKDKFTGGFEKGNIYLSGALGYWSTSTDDVKSSRLTIMPAVGYLVSDNFSVGFTAGYMSSQGESGDVDTQDETAFNVGAYGAYHFNADHRFAPFAGVGVGYESMSFNLPGDDYKENGFGAGLFTGANFWFSDCFAVFTQIGVLSFTNTKPDFDGAEATTNFAFNLDFKEITLGAKVLLN